MQLYRSQTDPDRAPTTDEAIQALWNRWVPNSVTYDYRVKQDCNHESCVVEFDEVEAQGMDSYEVQKRWPRWHGPCPECGVNLIKYATASHYIMGDW